ncbi:MAG: hypothetical protein WBB86_07575 [Candidatus Omnitrophota bacterium]
MKKGLIIVMALCLAASITLVGCGAQKAESGTAAIDNAKALKTTDEQAKYLMGQAQAFINVKEFQYAVDVLQYVLRYLDKDSAEAKQLLRKAQDAMAVEMQRFGK